MHLEMGKPRHKTEVLLTPEHELSKILLKVLTLGWVPRWGQRGQPQCHNLCWTWSERKASGNLESVASLPSSRVACVQSMCRACLCLYPCMANSGREPWTLSPSGGTGPRTSVLLCLASDQVEFFKNSCAPSAFSLKSRKAWGSETVIQAQVS
jgi:hypothetical protein